MVSVQTPPSTPDAVVIAEGVADVEAEAEGVGCHGRAQPPQDLRISLIRVLEDEDEIEEEIFHVQS